VAVTPLTVINHVECLEITCSSRFTDYSNSCGNGCYNCCCNCFCNHWGNVCSCGDTIAAIVAAMIAAISAPCVFIVLWSILSSGDQAVGSQHFIVQHCQGLALGLKFRSWSGDHLGFEMKVMTSMISTSILNYDSDSNSSSVTRVFRRYFVQHFLVTRCSSHSITNEDTV